MGAAEAVAVCSVTQGRAWCPCCGLCAQAGSSRSLADSCSEMEGQEALQPLGPGPAHVRSACRCTARALRRKRSRCSAYATSAIPLTWRDHELQPDARPSPCVLHEPLCVHLMTTLRLRAGWRLRRNLLRGCHSPVGRRINPGAPQTIFKRGWTHTETACQWQLPSSRA